MPNIYLGLVHHPVKNKNGVEITTSVTNLDVHDISRSCRTYGIKKYFIITPVQAQKELLDTIFGHWKQDEANAYNPDRFDALSVASWAPSVEKALDET